MALRNDPRMFSGGAVVLDSRPHLNLYLKLQEQKKQEEAKFGEYLEGQRKQVNPAGVRNQEQPVIIEMTKEMEDFAIKNRNAIKDPRKDNGAAKMEFERRVSDISNLINESKLTAKAPESLYPIWNDPDKRDRINKEKLNQALGSNDKVLRVKDANGNWVINPEHVRFNPMSVDFNPKPFDSSAFIKKFADVKRMALPPVVTKDPANFKQTTTTSFVFDEGGKDAIKNRAVSEYFNNDSFKSVVDNANPEEYRELFKKNFNRELEDKADLTAAVAFSLLQNEVKETEYKDDELAIHKEKAKIDHNYAVSRMREQERIREAAQAIKNAKTVKEEENALNKFIDGMYENTEHTDSVPVTVNGKSYAGRYVGVPSDFRGKYKKNIVTFNKRGQRIEHGEKEPDDFILTHDKKYIIPIYREKGGKKSQLYQGMSTPIPINTFKLELRPMLLSIKDAADAVNSGMGGDGLPATANDL